MPVVLAPERSHDHEDDPQEHRGHCLPHPPGSEFGCKSIVGKVSIERGSSSQGQHRDRLERRVWKAISRSPFESLWSLQAVPPHVLVVRTWKALRADRVFGHAAELGFYFLFAVFPILFCAGSILGLAAKSADQIYDHVLKYLALVVPAQALNTVLFTLKQTTAAATSGKVTLSSIGSIWAASVGISAIQSSLNAIYKIDDSRSYIVSQLYAIWLTFLLAIVVSIGLAAPFAANLFAAMLHSKLRNPLFASATTVLVRVLGWTISAAMLSLVFAIIYDWVPGWQTRRWRWFTPGGAIGLLGWLIASLGLRFYLAFFNRFSVVYGSLGAVIILLTWFYICGLMLLLGAEVNKEIERAGAENRLGGDVSSMGA